MNLCTAPYRAVGRLLTAAALAASLAVAGLGGARVSRAAPTQADLRSAEDRLHELERDFELVVERYNVVAERLDAIQAGMSATRLEVDRIETRMERRQASAVKIARRLYVGGGVEALEVVLSSEDLGEVENRLTYLETSQEEQLLVFERLATDRAALSQKLDELRAAQVKAELASARLSDLRATIEDKVAAERDEIEALNAALEEARRRRERRERLQAAAAQQTSGSETRSGGVGSNEAPSPPPPSPSPPPAPSGGAAQAVSTALAQVGKPYQWGASGPSSFDCSGLTLYSWASAGVSLPHSSAAQYASLPHVPTGAVQPGDLMFYGSPIHHVGLYIGSGRMVEAPYTGASVRVVSSARSDLVGAARPGG